MSEIIDQSQFDDLQNCRQSDMDWRNPESINFKQIFEDFSLSLVYSGINSCPRSKRRNQAIILEIEGGLTMVVILEFQQELYSLQGKLLRNCQLISITQKELRRLFAKQISKKSFCNIIYPLKLVFCFDSGQWFLNSPIFFYFGEKELKRQLNIILRELVTKMLTAYDILSKAIRELFFELTDLKRSKVHHILRYYCRCTVEPSISVKSDCAEYESVINKYSKSRFGLDQLIQFRKNAQASQNNFETLTLFGIDHKKEQVNYLNEISITEKQSIQNQTFIPLYPTVKPKENKFLFNFCYFYRDQYNQTFIAQGGNAYICALKPELIEHNISNDEDKNLQKIDSISKYISKHLVIKRSKSPETLSTQLPPVLDHETLIVSYLKGVSCLFLPKYYLNVDKQSRYYRNLLIDYLPGETLEEYLNMQKATLSIFIKLYILYQVLQALRFITQYGIAHLDVKEQNIIIIKNLVCKLVDFGQAYHLKICGNSHKPKFSIPYGAPEVVTSIKGREFTQKTDSYSFAIMMHRIIYGKNPFFAYDIEKFRNLHKDQRYYQKIFYVPQENEKYGSKIIIPILDQLIMKCLDFDEKKRPFLDWLALIVKSCLTYLTPD